MFLKKALLLSFICHSVLVIVMAIIMTLTPHARTRAIQVTYFQVQPPKAVIEKTTISIRNEPAIVTIRERSSEEEAKAAQAATAEQLRQNASAAAARKSKASKERLDVRRKKRLKKPPASKKILPQPTAEDLKIPEPADNGSAVGTIAGTTIPNTVQGMEYNRYIKEAILRNLENWYARECQEGEVAAVFVLDQSGELLSLKIIEERSSADPELRHIAYESIRSAAPFKPFPESLELKRVTFTLTVVFKRKQR